MEDLPTTSTTQVRENELPEEPNSSPNATENIFECLKRKIWILTKQVSPQRI